MAKNLYQVLGIPEHASREEVDSAYQVLHKKHQTSYDQGVASSKEELFAIDGAYEILYAPDKRAAYDAKLRETKKPRKTIANSVEPPKTALESFAKIAAGVVGTLVLVLIFIPKPEISEPPKREKPTYDAFNAQSACESFVKQALKAPSTADFAPHHELQISGSGTGPWTVIGYVDAQNSFGAKLRNGYFCKIHFVGDAAYPDEVRLTGG